MGDKSNMASQKLNFTGSGVLLGAGRFINCCVWHHYLHAMPTNDARGDTVGQ
jgi:hypothetical protein